MKTITLNDTKTGLVLEIRFDFTIGKMEINGNDVKRMPQLETDDNLFIYGFATDGANRLYTLSRDQIEQMHL